MLVRAGLIDVVHGVARIGLPHGFVTLVDESDLYLINARRWHARPSSSGTTHYVRSSGNLYGKCVKFHLHRLVTDAPPDKRVDHKNRDGLDNRRKNLRVCEHAQNLANRGIPINNTSGYKGVSWYKQTNKWLAHLKHGQVWSHLGYFSDPWEAAQAYNRAALAQWGEFALLNERLP